MSGGRFNYANQSLAYELYNGIVYPDHSMGSDDYREDVVEARRHNRFGDKVISEIVFDILCLIHSYDYFQSGDTSQESYLNDVKFFKDKWLTMNKKFIKETITKEVASLADELTQAFGLDEE